MPLHIKFSCLFPLVHSINKTKELDLKFTLSIPTRTGNVNVAETRLEEPPKPCFKSLIYRHSVVLKVFLVLVIQIRGIYKMLLRLQPI